MATGISAFMQALINQLHITMKKFILFFALAIISLTSYAQKFEIAGTTSFWRNTDKNTTSFEIAPELTYELTEKWGIGASVSYGQERENDGVISTDKVFTIAPYARYTYFDKEIISLFIDGGVGLAKVKSEIGSESETKTGFEAGLKPGIAIKVAERFKFISKIGFLGYKKNYPQSGKAFGFNLSGENIAVGFAYMF